MRGTTEVRAVTAALRRKASTWAARVPRRRLRRSSGPADYAHQPPVILTTIPKSGTHLVQQIMCSVPGVRDFGTFLPTIPSYGRRPRSAAREARQVRSLTPGELARAHLHHRDEVAQAALEMNAFVIFLVRDPRDVIVSEGHYLADSAPWHPLHREFSRRTATERIDVAISGIDDHAGMYPSLGGRLALWDGWLDDADVVLRFEDLVGPEQRSTIADLLGRYQAKGTVAFDVEQATDAAVAAIDPGRSHTFREGRVGGWREVLSAAQLARIDADAGAMLERYGYGATDQIAPAAGAG